MFNRLLCNKRVFQQSTLLRNKLKYSLQFSTLIDDEKRVTKLRNIFDDFSKDKISLLHNDVDRLLRISFPEAELDDERVRQMISVADIDNSGTIEFDEFSLLFDDIATNDISIGSLANEWLSDGDLR